MAELLSMEPTNLSKLERGLQFPKEENLVNIARVLKVNIKDLFDYEHFAGREIIIDEINRLVQEIPDKELQIYYKVLIALNESKK